MRPKGLGWVVKPGGQGIVGPQKFGHRLTGYYIPGQNNKRGDFHPWEHVEKSFLGASKPSCPPDFEGSGPNYG